MFINFIPLICGVLGLVSGVILGFVCTVIAIYSGMMSKKEPATGYIVEQNLERRSLSERMNNQDYALSHQPGNEASAIEEKQKREDSAYQFLKRNRKE